MTLTSGAAWTASCVSLCASWTYGNKSRWGPILGIVAFIPWMTVAIGGELWGLIPGNVLFTIVHVRNIFKMRGPA